SQHAPTLRAGDELAVARIPLELNAQIRAGRRDVDAVREVLGDDVRPERHPGALELAGGDGDIEVEADERLDIRVHGLASDDAIADPRRIQAAENSPEEIPIVHRPRPVEVDGMHRFPPR